MSGAVPLLLIVWLLARRHELGPLAPSAWAALGFAVVMLLLSFGAVRLLVSRCRPGCPCSARFRFPCRYLVLFQLAAAVLGGDRVRAADRAESSRARQRRRQDAP